MHHTAARRAFVVVAIVAVAVEAWIGAGRQQRRCDLFTELIVRERTQEPTAAGVGRFHLERAIGFAGMADHLVRDKRVEMRVGNNDDFAVEWFEDWSCSKLARFRGKFDGKFRERRIRHQLAAPSVAEALEPALLANGVVRFLMTVAVLRDDIAIALRERICLRDERAGSVDENLAAHLGHRCDDLVGDRVAERHDFAGSVERNFLQLVGRKRARIAAVNCLEVIADFLSWRNRTDEQTLCRIAEVSEQFRLPASTESRAIVCLVESAPHFRNQLRRAARERADFRAGLAVADGARLVCDAYGNKVRRVLALRAVARFAIHRGSGTIEDNLETKIRVDGAAPGACEARKDALALAPQVLDRFEQVAARRQRSLIYTTPSRLSPSSCPAPSP